jgi:hypothetical protein
VAVEEPSNEPKIKSEPPPEEIPVVSEEEADHVDLLDVDSLLDTAEDTQTQDKTSEPIALDKFRPPLQDEGHYRRVETDLASLSPLQPKRDDVTNEGKSGSIAQKLPVSNLHQHWEEGDQKQHDGGIKAALDVPNIQAGEEKSEAKKQLTNKSVLGLPNFHKGGRTPSIGKQQVTGSASETPQQEPVEFRPLRPGIGGRRDETQPIEMAPTTSKEDLKLQRLPELLTPITPKFPPVQGVQACTVVLWLWVETNGAPGEISVHKVKPSLGKTKEGAFRQAAIEAVKGAQFTPAHLDGQPVRLLLEMPIWFDRSRQQRRP